MSQLVLEGLEPTILLLVVRRANHSVIASQSASTYYVHIPSQQTCGCVILLSMVKTGLAVFDSNGQAYISRAIQRIQ